MDEKSEKLRIRISNSVDMLLGCKNRMCITDDSNELVLLYEGALRHIKHLYMLNLERLQIKDE